MVLASAFGLYAGAKATREELGLPLAALYGVAHARLYQFRQGLVFMKYPLGGLAKRRVDAKQDGWVFMRWCVAMPRTSVLRVRLPAAAQRARPCLRRVAAQPTTASPPSINAYVSGSGTCAASAV